MSKQKDRYKDICGGYLSNDGPPEDPLAEFSPAQLKYRNSRILDLAEESQLQAEKLSLQNAEFVVVSDGFSRGFKTFSSAAACAKDLANECDYPIAVKRAKKDLSPVQLRKNGEHSQGDYEEYEPAYEDDDATADYDSESEELLAEIADDRVCYARSEEDGWFYPEHDSGFGNNVVDASYE